MINSTVYNLDCELHLHQYPDDYFDWLIADPPYFSGPEKRKFYGNKVSVIGIDRVEYPVSDKWLIPGKEYFEQVFRISKNQIIFGCNYFDYKFGPGRIIWDKVNGQSSYSDCEIAYCSDHYSVRLFRYMWNGAMQGKSVTEGHIMQGNKKHNEKRIHPTQKPLALYRWMFNKYIKPGMKILDTHVGSGSSRIVAYDYGCDFTGYEIDPEPYNRQEDRFKQHKKNNSNRINFDYD